MGFQDWETPPEFFNSVLKLCDTLGIKRPMIDVAASKSNTKCDLYIDKETNGLSGVDWFPRNIETAWLQPPFQNMNTWLSTSIRILQNNKDKTILMLGPMGRSNWSVKATHYSKKVLIPTGNRIEFLSPKDINKYNGNMSDNLLFILTSKSVLSIQNHHWDLWDWRAQK